MEAAGIDPENPYEFGYANEVVQAFEVYTGNAGFNPLMPITSIINTFKKKGQQVGKWTEPNKKKKNRKL